jgi:hypothetical protein
LDPNSSHLPAWAFRRSASLRLGAETIYRQPPLCSRAHVDDFYPLGTPTFSRQQHGRARRDLRGHLNAILNEGNCQPSSPLPRIADPFVDSDVPGLCPGAKQILLRSPSDQPDCHPSCQKWAMVLLAGSSPSALRADSDRDGSPTFHGGQRDPRCPDAAQ